MPLMLEDVVRALAQKYTMIKNVRNDIRQNKIAKKECLSNMRNMKYPEKQDKISDETYVKICKTHYELNMLWLNKLSDELTNSMKDSKHQLRMHIKEMNSIIAHLKTYSKEGYKYLLTSWILAECESIQQSTPESTPAKTKPKKPLQTTPKEKQTAGRTKKNTAKSPKATN